MEPILNSLIDQYQEDIVKTVKELVEYPSVYEEGKAGSPFGEPIEKALEKVLEIGEKMGFVTQNYEGYAGTIQWGTQGKQVGILTHIDVVPPGDGWTYSPFHATIENGKIYGRGSLDDKGPMVAALFAVKAIKESGLPVKNHVRHIIGTDEESGFMRGLKYYLTKEDAPWGGFSPDAEFPVIHAEKGILRFHVSDQWQETENTHNFYLKELHGGTKVNIVPGSAYALVAGDDQAEKVFEECSKSFPGRENISIQKQEEGWRIDATGQGGHSSQPWNGKNAIKLLLDYLRILPLEVNGLYKFAVKVSEMFADGYKGEKLGVACEDKLSGILTLSLGVLDIECTAGKATVEIRYPIHASDEVIQKTLKVACANNQVDLEIFQDKKHVYLPVQAPLVQTLLTVYQESTGRSEEPIVIGGGTYCRAVENFVAYGPVFPGQRELAHEPDEYIGIEDLILTAKIYAQAIYTLLNLS